MIDLWVNYYPPDVFPSIWSLMDAAATQGAIFVIDEVLRELERKEDGLHDWVKARSGMIVPLDADIEGRVIQLMSDYPRLVDTRRNKSVGDPWVISLAQVRGLKVVTSEIETGSMTNPKIPDVCKGNGIPCLSVLDFFREQGWRV